MPINPIQQKNALDQFYTSDEVVNDCLEILRPIISQYKIDFYVEPSAGTGAFFNKFKKDIYGFDLDPKCKGVVEKNWYSVTRDLLPKGDFCIIGNPPFGIRNVDSKGFIKKAIELGCKMIAFVIPQVFEKLSIQKVYPENWKLLYSGKVKDNGFILNEEPYHVPCVFQVWTCLDSEVNLREKEPVLDNEVFEFVRTADEADVFVFGAAPLKIIEPKDVLPNNRGYYLKLKVSKDKFHSLNTAIDWKAIGKSSANGGVFWLTKGEYVKGFLQ